jgi:hypothetical protein
MNMLEINNLKKENERLVREMAWLAKKDWIMYLSDRAQFRLRVRFVASNC